MRHKDKGLTLVEVLVVVTILSILVASLYVVFKSAVDAWTKSKARLDIIQNARVILDQLSRELPGAFVDSTPGIEANFVGTDGGGTNPDTLEFVTYFAGKIYKLRYMRPVGTKILMRGYIENPPDYTNVDYADADPTGDDGIREDDVDFGFMVNDIQFYYLPVLNPPTSPVPPAASVDWQLPAAGSMRESWDSTDTLDVIVFNKLPEAVKIVLQLEDKELNTFDFETIVYLPNSTAN